MAFEAAWNWREVVLDANVCHCGLHLFKGIRQQAVSPVHFLVDQVYVLMYKETQ